jgi:hypothetical protein
VIPLEDLIDSLQVLIQCWGVVGVDQVFIVPADVEKLLLLQIRCDSIIADKGSHRKKIASSHLQTKINVIEGAGVTPSN